ncbi:MAG: radical SAM family heme chaperone HemW [Cellvibrionaceae bacterium]|nr:radical SAM family heme chaperone HemW [Cellvibrionaceae bacterium]
MKLPPLALYVHIPWCVRKCPYCDFNSHAAGENLPETEYINALICDLKAEQALAQGRKLQSIFIGGGTPSLFGGASFDQLLRAIEAQLGFADDIEITLEANPGTAEQTRFGDYRRAGIDRLSIGVQSFAPAQLQKLGRIHSAEQAEAAVDMARRAGFDNINIDIMHGLPGQSPAQAQQDLARAIQLGPEHLSWYQLTIEPNTEYYHRPPTLPVDDALAEIQQQGQAQLAEAGYQQYEVSAYSRQRPSRHNLNYWRFGDYLGIGAGAHGKISYADGTVERRWKTRAPNHYLARGGDYLAGSKAIEAEQLALEFMMNALRLSQGFELELFSQRSNLPLSSIEPQLRQLSERGLIDIEAGHLRASELGQRFLNDVIGSFMA